MSKKQRSPAARAVPTFLSPRAAADIFGLSRMTVYRAIRDGDLPAVRVRRRWLIPAQALDAMAQWAAAEVRDCDIEHVSQHPGSSVTATSIYRATVGSPLKGQQRRGNERAALDPPVHVTRYTL
jgi:excisionase family DNA binding protein